MKGLLKEQIVWLGIFISIIVVLVALGYFMFGFLGEQKEVSQNVLTTFSESLWGAIRGLFG